MIKVEIDDSVASLLKLILFIAIVKAIFSINSKD